MTQPDPALNRQWLLASRPSGKVQHSDFEYREQSFEVPDLGDGQILIHNRIFTCAPVMRNFLNEPGTGARMSVPLGAPVIGPVGSEVIASNNPDYPVGTLLETVGRWEDYSLIDPKVSPPIKVAPEGIGLDELMGPLSLNTMTAYYGVFDVGNPAPGDTVVVSAAAGSVGMMACQFAKNHGCRVIGIAGSAEKCRWLVEELKIDGAIDYKAEDVRARLAELCSGGVNFYFDNVGGDITQAVIDNIARHGRIAVCGQVSAYEGGTAQGPRDMMKIVYWAVHIIGFTITDYTAAQMAADRAKIWPLFREGKMISREDVRVGFDKLPASFMELFAGTNQGSLLVRGDA